MKKIRILILTHFFNPLNVTASYRPYSWLKYFDPERFDIDVFCKDWGPLDIDSKYFPKVHQVYIKNHWTYAWVTKYFTKIIFRHFYRVFDALLFFKGEKKLFNVIDQFVTKEKVDIIIATGGPFSNFNLAHKLKKKNPNLEWIADYRDEWSGNQLLGSKSKLLNRIVYSILRNLERSYLSSCKAFTTVSEQLVTNINQIIPGKQGFVIENGFDQLLNPPEKREKGVFHLAYTGKAYKNQSFVEVLDHVNFTAEKNTGITVKVSFIGSGFSKIKEGLLKEKYQNIQFNFEPYKSRPELEEFIGSVDAFLMVPYGNLKGIPSSKLYYYISAKKPVLLVPSDDGIIKKSLEKAGVYANNAKVLIKNKKEGKVVEGEIEKIHQFSREFQAKRMMKVVDQLLAIKEHAPLVRE